MPESSASFLRNEHSFRDLCLAMRPEMLCFARKLTRGDHARADDVVQDALLRAWRAWERWHPITVSLEDCAERLEATFGASEAAELTADDLDDFAEWYNEANAVPSARAWLFRIVSNEFMRAHQSATRRAEVVHEYGSLVGTFMDGGNDPRAAIDASVSDEMREALARLSPERRQVIEMCVLEELPYAEIARRTDVPEGTVMSRIHRAKKEMRATLAATRLGRTREDVAIETANGLQPDARRVHAVIIRRAKRPLIAQPTLDDYAAG